MVFEVNLGDEDNEVTYNIWIQAKDRTEALIKILKQVLTTIHETDEIDNGSGIDIR
jgi:hypothetical protein